MGLILFIVLVPIINLIILIIVACCSKSRKGYYGGSGPIIMSPENHSAPVEEGYKDTDDIADKLDSRFTNIVRNPLKGIL